MDVNVIGAGLAGCEAAWQLAERGVRVNLFEMKPKNFSPAHKSEKFAELVCSNSFKSNNVESASGLLKEEMRRLNSFILRCADECCVPAGEALAVDRYKFSECVTQKIRAHPLINVVCDEVKKILNSRVTIIATGPLTSGDFANSIIERLGEGMLSFNDAVAPIVTSGSIDRSNAFEASRYGKGNDSDYLNCPLEKDEYELFHKELISAECAKVHSFDKVYEGCMPIEIMAKRGLDTIRFGPMKPVGFVNPKTNKRPWAVLQLRKENSKGTLYNLVGFQTNLKFGEQNKVFRLIPALKKAEFIRYGVMHRNTFINSPKLLNNNYSLRSNDKIFFAGQITGVEGYMESTASGLVAGLNAYCRCCDRSAVNFPKSTMIGSLAEYVSTCDSRDFQPMGANFGIIEPLDIVIKNKNDKHAELSKRSLEILNKTLLLRHHLYDL